MRMVVSTGRIQEKVFSGALSGTILIETDAHYVSILSVFIKYIYMDPVKALSSNCVSKPNLR